MKRREEGKIEEERRGEERRGKEMRRGKERRGKERSWKGFLALMKRKICKLHDYFNIL